MSAVTICSDFGAPQNKVSHCFHCFPIYLPWNDGMVLVFWMLSFKPAFSPSSFTFINSRPIPVTAAFGSRTSYWPCWTYINEEEALSNQEDKMMYFAVISQPFSNHPNPHGPRTAMATLAKNGGSATWISLLSVPLSAWAANCRDQYLAPNMGTWW